MTGTKDEEVLFADEIKKVNRRGKPEKRFLIVTVDAFYVISMAIKKKQPFYNVTRRTALADISGISLSTLQDNLICLHIPKEYDNIFESDKKTEIAAIVMFQVELLTRSVPRIDFTDSITYKSRGGQSTMKFVKNEKCQAPVVGGGKCAVATGLSKDTDTAPKLPEAKPFTGGSANLASSYAGPMRGVGAPAGPMRGSSAPPQRGGNSFPSPAPPRGGGAPPRGGGNPGGRPSSKPQCKALYDFAAENPDELTFTAGSIIEVISQDGDWWTGVCNGQRGLFPGTYVEVAAASPAMQQNTLPPARGGARGAPPGGMPRGAPRGMRGPPGGPPRGAPRGAPRGRGF